VSAPLPPMPALRSSEISLVCFAKTGEPKASRSRRREVKNALASTKPTPSLVFESNIWHRRRAPDSWYLCPTFPHGCLGGSFPQMNNHFFSVVIPMHNAENHIVRAIESVLCQTFIDFEILIVDDGSTDLSVSLAGSICDPRIMIYHQENAGPGAARNTGIRRANGEWCALLDSDDVWAPDHLDELAVLIKKFPEAGMVCTRHLDAKAGKNPLFPKHPLIIKRAVVDYFRLAAAQISVVHSSGVALSRTAVGLAGAFLPEPYGEDLEYWARVATFCPVALSSKATFAYVRGTGGIMESITDKPNSTFAPATLGEVSPSVNMLVAKMLNSDLPANLIPSVVRYVNSRVSSCVRFFAIVGLPVQARACVCLYLTPVTHESTLWFLAGRQPIWLLRFWSLARRSFVRTQRLILRFFGIFA